MTLHVVNGDSTAATLRETSLGGDVLPWRDALHEGPFGTREERARFLASCGFGSYHGLLGDLVARDYALAGADNVVLWFEHDLYDQLQLVEILARRPTNAELIQATVYTGELDLRELEALWPTRAPVTAEQLELAGRGLGRARRRSDSTRSQLLGPAVPRACATPPGGGSRGSAAQRPPAPRDPGRGPEDTVGALP